MTRHRKLIRLDKHIFVSPEPIEHEPNCIGKSEYAAFDAFMLPRLKASRDEGSREVLDLMRVGRSLSDAVADVLTTLSAAKTRKLRAWIDEARSTRIYAYVAYSFQGGIKPLDAGVGLKPLNASIGLMKTHGGPKDQQIRAAGGVREIDKVTARDVGQYYHFEKALFQIKSVVEPASPANRLSRVKWLYEKTVPFVLVNTAKQYDEVMEIVGLPTAQSKWERAGLYDFRKMPPTYVSSVDEYVAKALETTAATLIDNMLKRSEWKKTCTEMLLAPDLDTW